MPDEARLWWEKAARNFQAEAPIPIDVKYGAHITEEKL